MKPVGDGNKNCEVGEGKRAGPFTGGCGRLGAGGTGPFILGGG